MMFYGDYKKRCLLTIMVSQILLLTLIISEIKNTLLQMDYIWWKIHLALASFIFSFEVYCTSLTDKY
jgi:hypothetical protein